MVANVTLDSLNAALRTLNTQVRREGADRPAAIVRIELTDSGQASIQIVPPAPCELRVV